LLQSTFGTELSANQIAVDEGLKGGWYRYRMNLVHTGSYKRVPTAAAAAAGLTAAGTFSSTTDKHAHVMM
jgi:hypothetical protein